MSGDAAMMATLRRLAIAAGAAILRVRAGADLGARTKADTSPVTEADLAADAIIVAGLRAAYPDIPVVTEERPESHALGGAGPHFLVDPLDGTREFVAGRAAFTVNIALVSGGRPQAGVLYAPALGRLFRTAPESGAVEENGGFDPGAEGPLRRLGVEEPLRRPGAGPAAIPAALSAVASLSHRDAATDAWLARSGVSDTRAIGSSLKFGLLAAGEAAVYPRLSPIMEWDTAAGEAVLTAAGGAVVAMGGGPLRYGDPRRVNAGFIAYAQGIAPQA